MNHTLSSDSFPIQLSQTDFITVKEFVHLEAQTQSSKIIQLIYSIQSYNCSIN